jgi:hypothetical protein
MFDECMQRNSEWMKSLRSMVSIFLQGLWMQIKHLCRMIYTVGRKIHKKLDVAN